MPQNTPQNTNMAGTVNKLMLAEGQVIGLASTDRSCREISVAPLEVRGAKCVLAPLKGPEPENLLFLQSDVRFSTHPQ